jgi:hypothetical protein
VSKTRAYDEGTRGSQVRAARTGAGEVPGPSVVERKLVLAHREAVWFNPSIVEYGAPGMNTSIMGYGVPGNGSEIVRRTDFIRPSIVLRAHGTTAGNGLERQISSRELEPSKPAAFAGRRERNGVGYRPRFSPETAG